MRRSYIVSLLSVVIIAASSLTAVLAAGWAPVLGVQLQGGVEVVLRPPEEVTDEQLDRAIEIIRSRIDALGADAALSGRTSRPYSCPRRLMGRSPMKAWLAEP